MSVPRVQPVRLPERTLPALLIATARRVPERVFLRLVGPAGPPPPRTVTFGGFATGVARGVALLRAAGVEAGDRVLLFAANSPEWQMLALAAQCLRAEPAALFASLAGEQARTIARRVRPRVALVGDAEGWSKLAPAGGELAAAGLAALVAGEPLHPASLPNGLTARTFATAFGDGAPAVPFAELAALAAAVGEEDPFLLLFTSGTTGRPKGVRVPQRAAIRVIDTAQGAVGLTEEDVGLHFLPYGHVAGHAQFVMGIGQGQELLMVTRREEIEPAFALRPTYIFSVPAVYERVRAGVEQKLAAMPAPLRATLRGALAAAERYRLDGSRSVRDRLGTALADRAIGRAVRAKLGGRIRALYAGGAAVPPALFRFFEALGIPMVEIYGMSETAGMIACNYVAGPRLPGCAGRVSADHEVRFGPDGELLLRGPLLLSGFLEEEDGRGAWTEDGFFRTGDLGRLDDDGWLWIEGRSKNMLALSTGKKLSPEPIEQAIAAREPFRAAVLFGEGRPFVAAAVFVDRAALDRFAAAGLDAERELLGPLHAALDAFSDHEKPKRLTVLPGEPADYPELLTPTLKIRRDALLARLGPAAEELFTKR
ncbi:MAG: AMP-binding protein [Acidobacteria bacterium]|jgi:long-chain acyl-CoA synthetase|nr:AMP-binding protein [Thermoanaerobaculia bacterium]NLN10295.1 AMP-binding protein [Acidobacteriota bacterium]MBP7812516.1 AMP-binding protein [Thermoanaerobaculia bacterium]HNU82761.1 AMP-binding protein [Thermoanaerobaculia bacterium]HPA95580.1 AMP-binding protein [Thermoanaerobaculia bacterium]